MGINIQGRTGWNSIPNSIGRSKLPHPTVHLLVNLLSHAEGFNAGYSLITQQTGMAPATIAKAIKNLEKLGLLTVSKKKGQSGQFSSNHYTFHADLLWKLTPEFVDERLRSNKTTTDSEVGKDAATGAEVGTATGAEAAPLQELKRKKDQGEGSVENDQSPLAPQGADGASAAGGDPAMARFPEFYDTYGRKKKRPDAERAWKKAIKKADPQVIIDAAAVFIESQKATNKHPQYTPFPASWLNGEQWNDEVDDHQATQSSSSNGFDDWWGNPDTTDNQLPWGNDVLHDENIIDHQENHK